MLLLPSDNLLLYGLTGSGKTTQVAAVIRQMVKETGKKALAFVSDWGSVAPLLALEQQGVVDLERYRYGADAFLWIDQIVQGKRQVNGKWVLPDHSQYCLAVMESLSGMGDLGLHVLGHQVAEGKNVGGDAMRAPSLAIASTGGTIHIASNSPTHYGMIQKFLLEKVWQSQLLPFPVIWTAHEDVAAPEKRDDQGSIRAEVAVAPGVRGMIGPLVAGHALTMHLGKYFVLMFRLKQEVTATGVQHVLLTTRHKDGLYEGLGANRVPLGATVPGRQQPADVVKMLQMIQAARVAI